MTVNLLKSKIHQARITQSDLHYEGSLAIDLDLLDAAGILPYEHILVVNGSNGERLETYAIPAARGSRMFCLNGAAAHRGSVGDWITVMSFAHVALAAAPAHRPTVIILNERNEIVLRKETQTIGEITDAHRHP